MDLQELIPPDPQTEDWIERLARFGYAAKGAVYTIVGLLALLAALDWGGIVTGSEGALQAISFQPFGRAILAVVALGLSGYVLWQFVQVIKDPEHIDRGMASLGRRLSFGLSGLIYAGLAFYALKLVFGQISVGASASQQRAASLLLQPLGRWLVAAVGVAGIAYGAYEFYRASSTRFHHRLKLAQMQPTTAQWVILIARFGLIAKGIVAVIIGHFLIQAARLADASQFKNTEGALETLQRQPHGAGLMGLVALGLIAHGIHLILQARYRRISP